MFLLANVTHRACERRRPRVTCCHWTGVFSCRYCGLSGAGLSHPSLSVFLGRVWWCLLSELLYMQRQVREGFSVYVRNEGQSHEKECVNYYSLNSRLKEERLT